MTDLITCLMESHLSIFAFVTGAFGVNIQEIISKTNVKKLFPCVLLQEFYSFSLTF